MERILHNYLYFQWGIIGNVPIRDWSYAKLRLHKRIGAKESTIDPVLTNNGRAVIIRPAAV